MALQAALSGADMVFITVRPLPPRPPRSGLQQLRIPLSTLPPPPRLRILFRPVVTRHLSPLIPPVSSPARLSSPPGRHGRWHRHRRGARHRPGGQVHGHPHCLHRHHAFLLRGPPPHEPGALRQDPGHQLPSCLCRWPPPTPSPLPNPRPSRPRRASPASASTSTRSSSSRTTASSPPATRTCPWARRSRRERRRRHGRLSRVFPLHLRPRTCRRRFQPTRAGGGRRPEAGCPGDHGHHHGARRTACFFTETTPDSSKLAPLSLFPPPCPPGPRPRQRRLCGRPLGHGQRRVVPHGCASLFPAPAARAAGAAPLLTSFRHPQRRAPPAPARPREGVWPRPRPGGCGGGHLLPAPRHGHRARHRHRLEHHWRRRPHAPRGAPRAIPFPPETRPPLQAPCVQRAQGADRTVCPSA